MCISSGARGTDYPLLLYYVSIVGTECAVAKRDRVRIRIMVLEPDVVCLL